MTQFTAYKIELRAVEALIPYARNARTHSDAQVAQIAASIREFGWTNPVLIDGENGIIAGHGRLLAARKLGLAEVPCIALAHLSAAQKRALILADNKLALNAGWDDDLLRVELSDLQVEGFDLALAGFSDTELEALLAERTEGLTDPDEAPEPPVEPVSALGDVWLLGRHRLVCGDCTTVEAVDAALRGAKVDAVFTSPPYGVGIEYGQYEDTIDNLRKMLPQLAALWYGCVVPGGFAVINFGDIVSGSVAARSNEPCEYPMAVEYWPAFRAADWTLWTRRVWQKPHAKVHSPWAIQSCRAASDWEHLWVWKTPGKPITMRGDYSAFGVWDTSKDHGVDVGKKTHGAGMAVSLATRGVETHSRPGKGILEPFSGSGTTIIAAEMTGRACHAIELEPRYVDVAVTRWQNSTGKQATLESDDRTFDVIGAERMPKAD